MWILFASLNPVTEAIRSMYAKKASKHVHPLILGMTKNIIPMLLFVPMLFFIDVKWNAGFWIGVTGSGIINTIAAVYYMKAISEGDLSEVMPMLSFTPLFMLITSPIMVGEFPNIFGLIGIVLIVGGSYLLNYRDMKGDILKPFKSLVKNRGTRFMLIVAVIWSLSSNFDKISIENSSVIQHIAFVNAMIVISLTILIVIKGVYVKESFLKARKDLIMASGFTTLSFVFHMTAVSMTLVAYVVALKRMSGVISVMLGHFFLQEANMQKRLLGSSLMFAGVLFIVLS